MSKLFKSGVCDFYTTLYREYIFIGTHVEGFKSVISAYRAPHPSRKEGSL